MRNTFVDTVIDGSRTRSDVFILAGDAGLGVFDTFQQTDADRFLNMGVAEQNMAGFAAGLALSGFKVYIYNIVPFVLYRCYEQVRNDICYQRLPVVLTGIGSGVTYAPAGMTHYAVEDIGLCQTLPNLTVISPIDPVEARLAARYTLSADHPCYVRLAKRGEPVIHEREDFDITIPQVIRDGEDLGIVFHGSISVEVMQALPLLARAGIHPRVVSAPVVQPLNVAVLFERLQGLRQIITVEEHFAHCGLGDILGRACLSLRPAWRLRCLGIPARYVHAIQDTAHLREAFGISAAQIARVCNDGL